MFTLSSILGHCGRGALLHIVVVKRTKITEPPHWPPWQAPYSTINALVHRWILLPFTSYLSNQDPWLSLVPEGRKDGVLCRSRGIMMQYKHEWLYCFPTEVGVSKWASILRRTDSLESWAGASFVASACFLWASRAFIHDLFELPDSSSMVPLSLQIPHHFIWIPST